MVRAQNLSSHTVDQHRTVIGVDVVDKPALDDGLLGQLQDVGGPGVHKHDALVLHHHHAFTHMFDQGAVMFLRLLQGLYQGLLGAHLGLSHLFLPAVL